MKITKETKFDVGQEVFTVWNHMVVPCEVRDIFLDGCLGGIFLTYTLIGRFVEDRGVYMERVVCEREIFATKQEAQVECNDRLHEIVKQDIMTTKRSICQVTRGRKISDCGDDENLKEALRILKKTNSELAGFLRSVK